MYNTKEIIRNNFRISRVRGESVIRLRMPGGHLEAKYLGVIQDLAEKFGNGTVHLTTRQAYEIPGIKLAELEVIRKAMAEMLYAIESESDVILEEPESGYPTAGARNVSACIGNRVCQFSNTDTTALAQKIEKAIFPNDFHLKIAATGCPNDCIKAHMNDFGIIATVIPEYDEEKCIACEACMDNCRKRVTNALSIRSFRIERDEKYCIKCGECILKCPTGAFSRGKQLYRMILGGRTGKRNPRIANTFIIDASEAVVLSVCRNVYRFIDRYIDRSMPKEHLGYIIDRAGYKEFLCDVMEGIELNPEAEIASKVDNPGYSYAVKST